MRNAIRAAAAGLALALTTVLSGCTVGVDTASFEQRLDQLPGLNGALVEVQHPGLPTNTQVAVWAFVDKTDVPSSVAAVHEIAEAVGEDPSIAGHAVIVAVVPGDPADYPNRADVVHGATPVMHEVAEQLGLPESDDEMLVLDRDAVRLLTGTTG